ncbi:hypothetical protein RCO48_25140 [Peribacillus frigoritolerans]|nr:hypothetical protein [Peribacillus frigoritolerans]
MYILMVFFYTSVRDLNNTENEIEVVKQFIYEMAGKGLNDGKDAIMQSANALVERHLKWLKEQYEEEHADEFEVLSELPHEERIHLTNQVDSLLKEKKIIDWTHRGNQGPVCRCIGNHFKRRIHHAGGNTGPR